MMAAARAAERGARVVLFEKNKELGLKLLMTGHGRCNLTNLLADKKENISVYGVNAKFLFSAFKKFGVEDTLNFFAGLNVATKTEDKDRVFPRSNKASDVKRALHNFLKAKKVELVFEAEVKKFVKEKNEIRKVVLANGQEIFAKNFIIATGGKSYPATGSQGDAFAWLAQLGHKTTKPRPALVPVIVKERIVKALEGLSFSNLEISVFHNNKKVISQAGEIIFTADGLSGPLVLDLSSRLGSFLPDSVTLKLDFFPEIKLEKFEAKLQDDFHHSNNKIAKNYLLGFLPLKLIPIILKIAGINGDKPVNLITKEERRALALAIKQFILTVMRLKDFDKAMITAGGVDVREVDPRTMRSKLFENLYFAGEVLDLDGPTGGYNLQICWSTGYTAGDSVKF